MELPFALAASAFLAASGPSEPARAGWACGGVAEADVIASVDGQGEVRLASGRHVRLVDIRLADAGAAPAGLAWLASLAGSAVTARAVGGADRWGRHAAALMLPDGIDVAELLVGEGLALVDAGERDGLCSRGLLSVEEGARRRSLGLWRDRPPVPANDAEAVREAGGRFAVLEGRIASVGERGQRTYLNFGRDFTRDLAVVVPRRLWAEMRRDGLSAASLRGRRVRVRGTVEIRRGPLVEIASRDMLEWPDGAPGRP